MAFGYGNPALEDIRRRADAQRVEAERMRSGPKPELPPLVGPGGMFWESFEAPDIYGRAPAPERAPAPWEYGPPMPSVGLPPGPMRSMPTNDPSLDADIRNNILPQIPGIEAKYAPQMPGVLSGASSTAGPSVGLPPPPQASGLRVKLGGGDWQEADPEGRLPMPPQERSSTAYDPTDRRVEAVSAPSGGGTFSMMTAPENVDIATRGSQLEDAQFRQQMREADDPMKQFREQQRIGTDERIRYAEAADRIQMGKQTKMAEEADQIQQESDQNEFALAQKYGIDPRDSEGSSIQDEARRMQYQQERESLKRQVQARMTVLLSRYGMAPRNAAGYEALSGL